jgi:hypothetical protein
MDSKNHVNTLSVVKITGIAIWLGLFITIPTCEKNPGNGPPPTEIKGTISGIVTDWETQTPLEGVLVAAVNNQATDITDAMGNFHLENLPPGEDTLKATAPGYYPQQIMVQITEEVQEIDLVLKCNPTLYMDTSRVYFYYYQNQPLYLTLAADLLMIEFDSLLTPGEIESLAARYDIFKLGKISYTENMFLYKVLEGKRAEEFYTFYGENTTCGLGNQPFVYYATPVFWLFPGIDSSLAMLTDEFIAKIDTTTMPLVRFWEINREHNVELAEEYPYQPYVFILRVTKQSVLNAMDMANLYQDSAYVVFAEPNLRQLIPPP